MAEGTELRCEFSAAGVISTVDFDLSSEPRPLGASEDGVFKVGEDTKSLNELSVSRGAFHGNRRNDMHAKIMAKDQISAG